MCAVKLTVLMLGLRTDSIERMMLTCCIQTDRNFHSEVLGIRKNEINWKVQSQLGGKQ